MMGAEVLPLIIILALLWLFFFFELMAISSSPSVYVHKKRERERENSEPLWGMYKEDTTTQIYITIFTKLLLIIER